MPNTQGKKPQQAPVVLDGIQSVNFWDWIRDLEGVAHTRTYGERYDCGCQYEEDIAVRYREVAWRQIKACRKHRGTFLLTEVAKGHISRCAACACRFSNMVPDSEEWKTCNEAGLDCSQNQPSYSADGGQSCLFFQQIGE